MDWVETRAGPIVAEPSEEVEDTIQLGPNPTNQGQKETVWAQVGPLETISGCYDRNGLEVFCYFPFCLLVHLFFFIYIF